MWTTIKAILQKHGGTCIIIEEGKPAYVVTSFDNFQKSLESEKEEMPVATKPGNISEQELLERINQEITNWKIAQTAEEAAKEIEEEIKEEAQEEIRIEDLPL